MDDKYSSENHEIITEKTESTQNEDAGTEGFEPEKSPIHKSNGEITPIVISNYSNGIIDGIAYFSALSGTYSVDINVVK